MARKFKDFFYTPEDQKDLVILIYRCLSAINAVSQILTWILRVQRDRQTDALLDEFEEDIRVLEKENADLKQQVLELKQGK